MQREQLIAAARELSREVSTLKFEAPVAYTYNPLEYAWDGHEAYIRKFGVCRLCFRELAVAGLIPGVTKASW